MRSRSILVVGTPSRAAFADMMLSALHGALAELGEDAHLLLLEDAGQVADVQGRARDLHDAGRDVFLVDFNGTFNARPSESFPIRHRITLLLDHPYRHLEKLIGYPPRLSLGVVDRSHLSALADWELDWPVHFFPHSGPAPDPVRMPFAERDIDVLFCANLSPLVFEEVFRHNVQRLPEGLRDVAVDAVRRVQESGGSVHAAVRDACREVAGRPLAGLPLAALRAAVLFVEQTVTGLGRRDIVEALVRTRGVRIHIVGNVPQVLDLERLGRGPEIHVHGVLPFDAVVEMMGRSRIVINANLAIADGSHERIWQAIAKGAVVATHESAFMREGFGADGSVLFLPREGVHLANWLGDRLRDPEALEAGAERAVVTYAADHVWRRRVRGLTDILDGVQAAG